MAGFVEAIASQSTTLVELLRHLVESSMTAGSGTIMTLT